MRIGFNCSRHLSQMLVAIIAWSLPNVAAGQTPPCKQKVEPVSGSMGYQNRGYGCEGFIVQPQANLNIQVLSLIQGAVPMKNAATLLIGVPPMPDSLASNITVFGSGTTAGMNWALDGSASPNSPMKWSVTTVASSAGLNATSLGLLGRTSSSTRFATPWYVAVRVAETAAAFGPSANPQHAQDTDLVVRIPAASAIQFYVPSLKKWQAAVAMDGDGRFKCTIPATERGAQELQLKWRPRGATSWSDVETLRLWLW